MSYLCKKAAPQTVDNDSAPWSLMLTDPCKLKGDEVLLGHFPPRGWLYQTPQGELISVWHTGLPFGFFRLADREEEAWLKERYATRAGLERGDLVSAVILVEGKSFDDKELRYQMITESCRFESFADAEHRFAWVTRPDGSRYKTRDFAAYEFETIEALCAKIEGRWTCVYFSRALNDQEIEVYIPGYASAVVKRKDVRTLQEAIVPEAGERVNALIGDRWKENCIFLGGSLGNFSVQTPYLRIMKTAVSVQPMKYQRLDEAA